MFNSHNLNFQNQQEKLQKLPSTFSVIVSLKFPSTNDRHCSPFKCFYKPAVNDVLDNLFLPSVSVSVTATNRTKRATIDVRIKRGSKARICLSFYSVSCSRKIENKMKYFMIVFCFSAALGEFLNGFILN